MNEERFSRRCLVMRPKEGGRCKLECGHEGNLHITIAGDEWGEEVNPPCEARCGSNVEFCQNYQARQNKEE